MLLISCLPCVPGSGPMNDGAFGASQVLPQSTNLHILRAPWLHTIQSNKPVVRLEEEHQLLLPSQMVMAESLSLMEQHGDQQAILDSMGDASMSSSAGAVVALSVDLSVDVSDVPCSEPVDDDAFEASQILLQSTTPDVLRTPWLHTTRSNRPLVRLEEAGADREHQLLLEYQTVMAENLSLMEQYNDQQAILISMGDAPMPSSAGAVVASSVDPFVGVGGSTAASSGVRLFVVSLPASAVLLVVAAVGGPSGLTLRVVGGVAGSDIRAGDYLAAVNNAR